MDPRLQSIYRIPQDLAEREIYLQDLAEHCAHLEEQIRSIADCLPHREREILESYMDIRDELEFQSVKLAIKLGKQQVGNVPLYRK